MGGLTRVRSRGALGLTARGLGEFPDAYPGENGGANLHPFPRFVMAGGLNLEGSTCCRSYRDRWKPSKARQDGACWTKGRASPGWTTPWEKAASDAGPSAVGPGKCGGHQTTTGLVLGGSEGCHRDIGEQAVHGDGLAVCGAPSSVQAAQAVQGGRHTTYSAGARGGQDRRGADLAGNEVLGHVHHSAHTMRNA